MKLIVVDANGLAHKVRHSYRDLSWKGERTNVLYGFIRQVLKLSEKFDTNRFVFCWDSRESLRSEIFPDYKKKRGEKKALKSDDERAIDYSDFEQIDALRTSVLRELGFCNNFIAPGIEGDDIIASVVKDERNEGGKVIVSSDHDMYQLLDHADIYYARGKKDFFVTKETLLEREGVTPDQWAEAMCVAGCSTDEVPGVKGVGMITAIKYLQGVAAGHVASKIAQASDIIERNRKLIKLPFETTPKFDLVPDTFSAFSIMACVEQHGMYSLSGKNFNMWRGILRDEFK